MNMAALSLILGVFVAACGSGNVFDCEVRKSAACSEKTPEEKAQQHIDAAVRINVQSEEDAIKRRELFSQAIDALESVHADHATDLGFNSLLASVYAARGGMLLWDILKEQVFSNGGSVSVGIDSPFIPGPEDVVAGATYQSYVDDVGAALTVLAPFEADAQLDSSSEPARVAASLQLALYYPVHTFMTLKLLVQDSTGTLDPSKLAAMTDEQAVAFVNQVAKSAEVVSQMSSLSDAQKAQVQKELAKINDQPGDAKAKIDQYLAKGGTTTPSTGSGSTGSTVQN